MQKDQDGTLTFTITLPWKDVAAMWELEVEAAVKHATLPGFRKGKAPRKLVEENIDKAKVREEVLKKLLPQSYIKAVEEQKVNPVLRPLIHVEKVDEGEDWEFTAKTCEAPVVELNDYKKKVQDVTSKSKIVIPGKEKEEPKFDDIMKALLDSVTISVPKIIVDQEVERLLTQLVDDVRRLGMTLDQYLSSSGKTADALRAEYEEKALADIKLEFALQKVSEVEKITVEPQELDEAIQKAKDDTERQQMEANRYLLASILRQQKTLDFLKNL